MRTKTHFSLLLLLLVVVGCASTTSVWHKTLELNTIEAYQEFLREYPQSEFTTEANRRIETLTWEASQRSNTIEAYQKFLREYPQSEFAAEAGARVQKLQDEQVETYNNAGNQYLARGNWDMAIDQFNRAIALSPTLPNPYNGRGSAHSRKGEFAKAIEDFSKAIEIDSNDATAYSNRGIAYVDKGDIDLAFKDFSAAIEKDPSLSTPYNNRGVYYAQKGMMDKAIADFSKACDLRDQEGCKNLRKALSKSEATKPSPGPTPRVSSAGQSKGKVVEGTVTEANFAFNSMMMAKGLYVTLKEYPGYSFYVPGPGIMKGMKVRLHLKGPLTKGARNEVSEWEQL